MPCFGIGAATCAIWYVIFVLRYAPTPRWSELRFLWTRVYFPSGGERRFFPRIWYLLDRNSLNRRDWTVKQRQIKYRSLATTSPMPTIFAPYDFFCRSHINFISDILETKQNLNIARKTAEDLTRRLDLLVRNFDFMSEVLQSLEPSKAPSRIRRKLRRWAMNVHPLLFVFLSWCWGGWVKEKTSVWAGGCMLLRFSWIFELK